MTDLMVRKARRKMKLTLRQGDVQELEELAEFLREKGYEHADAEVALETILREFFRSQFKARKQFRRWRRQREKLE